MILNGHSLEIGCIVIVDTWDKPQTESAAIITGKKGSIWKYLYVLESLNGVGERGAVNPTPIEKFGIGVTLASDFFRTYRKLDYPVTAEYDDGSPRLWQGQSLYCMPLELVTSAVKNMLKDG